MFFDTISSDIFLIAAFWIGVVAIGLIFILIAQIIVLRIKLKVTTAKNKKSIEFWRPLLIGAISGDYERHLLRVGKSRESDFIKLWLHFQESLRGDARESLNGIATRLGCKEIAINMMNSGNRGDRLIAVIALGYLGEKTMLEAMYEASLSADRLLAFHASAAVVRIDPDGAIADLTPQLVRDLAWPVREIVSILKDCPGGVEKMLKQSIQNKQSNILPRILQIMDGLKMDLDSDAVAELLQDDDLEIKFSVLRMVSSPASRPHVLRLAEHEDWRVRMHVAKALGRVGVRDDVEPLCTLLADKEWWVRYRSAQVLVGLPFLKNDDLVEILHGTHDRYAADMLRQVLAECEAKNG